MAAVRCGAAAVVVVRSRAVADCAGLAQVMSVLMLLVVRCVPLLVFYGRAGVLTQSGKSSWWSMGSLVEVGKVKSM